MRNPEHPCSPSPLTLLNWNRSRFNLSGQGRVPFSGTVSSSVCSLHQSPAEDKGACEPRPRITQVIAAQDHPGHSCRGPGSPRRSCPSPESSLTGSLPNPASPAVSGAPFPVWAQNRKSVRPWFLKAWACLSQADVLMPPDTQWEQEKLGEEAISPGFMGTRRASGPKVN